MSMSIALPAVAPVAGFREFKQFSVIGEPVPWSTPDIGVDRRRGKTIRFAKKNKALADWQMEVHLAARKCYGPREPWLDAVFLSVFFLISTEDPDLEGRLVVPPFKWSEAECGWKKQGFKGRHRRGLPDSTNLFKAVEDGMKGTFFVDDSQVRIQSSWCCWAAQPRCDVAIGLMDSSEPFSEYPITEAS